MTRMPMQFVLLVLSIALTACNGQGESNGAHADDHGHIHDNSHAEHADGHGGAIVELGTTTIGDFTVRASRDEGQIEPGGDAPVDVWLTGGDISNVTAVRFWIGDREATSSIKARAEIENPEEPNHWHTHIEVPDPLPTDAQLWIEIESTGDRESGSFPLNG